MIKVAIPVYNQQKWQYLCTINKIGNTCVQSTKVAIPVYNQQKWQYLCTINSMPHNTSSIQNNGFLHNSSIINTYNYICLYFVDDSFLDYFIFALLY